LRERKKELLQIRKGEKMCQMAHVSNKLLAKKNVEKFVDMQSKNELQ
jgi:hypothetical protein